MIARSVLKTTLKWTYSCKVFTWCRSTQEMFLVKPAFKSSTMLAMVKAVESGKCIPAALLLQLSKHPMWQSSSPRWMWGPGKARQRVTQNWTQSHGWVPRESDWSYLELSVTCNPISTLGWDWQVIGETRDYLLVLSFVLNSRWSEGVCLIVLTLFLDLKTLTMKVELLWHTNFPG